MGTYIEKEVENNEILIIAFREVDIIEEIGDVWGANIKEQGGGIAYGKWENKGVGFVWAGIEVMFWKGKNCLGGKEHFSACWISLTFCLSSEDVQEDLDLEPNGQFWGDTGVVLCIT